MLVGIARRESGLETMTLRDDTSGQVLQGAGVIDAARRLIVAGHSVDLGAWQINSRDLSLLSLGVADAFEPCKAVAPTGTGDLGLMPPAYELWWKLGDEAIKRRGLLGRRRLRFRHRT